MDAAESAVNGEDYSKDGSTPQVCISSVFLRFRLPLLHEIA